MSAPRTNPDLDLVIERVVDARPELLWKAWTDPEHLKHWFAPHPYTVADAEIDPRPGGIFSVTMRDPEGTALPRSEGCCLEVIPQRKLVWTDALGPGFRPNGAGFLTAVILFQPEGSGTRYTAIAFHKDPEDREKHESMGFFDGWGTVIDQLAAYARDL